MGHLKFRDCLLINSENLLILKFRNSKFDLKYHTITKKLECSQIFKFLNELLVIWKNLLGQILYQSLGPYILGKIIAKIFIFFNNMDKNTFIIMLFGQNFLNGHIKK